MTPPAFSPVPSSSTRHDGWTPAVQAAFLLALAKLGGVAKAARAVGRTPQSANRLRRRPGAESFAAAWDTLLADARFRALAAAVEEARDGRLVPVTYRGRVIGQRRRFDNRLLFAACYGEPIGRYER